MHESDFQSFGALLDQVCSLLSKGSYKPDPQGTALWFRTLSAYSVELVRAGFDAHVRDPDRGRFVPTPADIIAKISAHDGRVNADEAWAIAVKASDEAQTVTWNDEIVEAWNACAPVWAIGDKVAARMAFKDAYARVVAAAKQAGKRVNWWPTLGHDEARRLPEVERAANDGLIGFDAPLALPKPLNIEQMPPRVRETLLKLREKLAANIASNEEEKAEVGRLPDPPDQYARGGDLLSLGVVGAQRRALSRE